MNRYERITGGPRKRDTERRVSAYEVCVWVCWDPVWANFTIGTGVEIEIEKQPNCPSEPLQLWEDRRVRVVLSLCASLLLAHPATVVFVHPQKYSSYFPFCSIVWEALFSLVIVSFAILFRLHVIIDQHAT